MRLQHVIEAVFHRPWLITPSGHASITALIESKLEQAQSARQSGSRDGRGVDFFTGELIPGMTVAGGVAEIPIHGVIGQRVGMIEKSCGAVDVGDIEHELEQAEADPLVRAVLLNIDSPGGMVSGTPELADRISRSSKPVWSFSDGMVGSAAYWLAAATGGLFGTRGSEWGSIGVYVPWMDKSGLYAGMGIKVKVFSSGTYKGMGYPGTELTAEQELFLQSSVNEIADDFYSHVRGNRGNISDDVMQGQMFSAKNAKISGLIDGIVSSKAELLRMI